MIIKDWMIFGYTKEIRRIVRRLPNKKSLLNDLNNYPTYAPVILSCWGNGKFTVNTDAYTISAFFGQLPIKSNYEIGRKLFSSDMYKAWKYANWKDTVVKNNRI